MLWHIRTLAHPHITRKAATIRTMAREWCIPVQISPRASNDETDLVRLALEMASFDVDREGDTVLCYVDAPHSPKKARKRIHHVLADSDVTHAIVTPLQILEWDEDRLLYVDPDAPEPPPELDPWEIRWAVAVTPTDVFVERRVRSELERRGRTMIEVTASEFVVGARDEADAQALVAELDGIPEVANAEPRKLGWFARWQVRQRLLGNYGSVDGDPSRP